MNLPFLLEGKLAIQPYTKVKNTEDQSEVFCPGCGGLMRDRCRNPDCGSTPAQDAVFCQHCGTSLVAIPPHLKDIADPKAFVVFQWEQRDRLFKQIETASKKTPAQP